MSSVEVHNGVRNWYGSRNVEDKLPGEIKTEGMERTITYDFAYDDLPVESNDGSMSLEIPADALITGATIHVKTAAQGGTSYNFGLYQADGTVIDADGIDAAVATAALTEGAWIVCDGALIGATIGSAAGQLRVAATGGFTAGEYRVQIDYVRPRS